MSRLTLLPRACALLACACALLACAYAPVALADEAAAAEETAAPAVVDWSAFGDADTTYVDCVEAILVDGDGNVLFSRSGDVPMAMASVTKVMTAVVALESGLSLDTPIVATESVWDVYGQTVGLVPGETYTLGELLRGLLVHSGNDAAVCIAEGVAGSLDAFVALMNEKAAELGMVGTHYVNPHGLDADGHQSTPADLVTLARYAMNNATFQTIVGSTWATMTISGEEVTFTSTDELLDVYPGMRGVKTGYTDAAGRAFLGTATRGGVDLYVCVLGCGSDEQRWADVSRLLDWGFSHYDEETLVEEGTVVGYVASADRFGWTLPVTASSTATRRTSPFGDDGAHLEDALVASDGLIASGAAVGPLVWDDAAGEYVASTVAAADGSPVASAAFGPLVSLEFLDS